MRFDFGFYWALLLRRLPVMILFVLLFSGVGIVAALQLPNVYSTSARLLVEEPLIPDNMVASTVRTSAIEQLAVIEQRLMTRANLIDIANKFDVFEDLEDMEPDTLVSAVRAATKVRRPRAGRSTDRATLMVISFEARSPQIAAAVVNEYVTLVLQENAKFRETRAENTLEFFEQEVERLNNDLDQQSGDITLFKAENASALPENQQFRDSRKALLLERLGQFERSLATLKEQRELALQAFENREKVSQGPAPQQRSSFERELIVAEAELKKISDEYGPDNPRIIRLQDRIKRLEAIISAQNKDNAPVVQEDEGISPQQAFLDASLAEIDSKISTVKSAIDSTASELEEVLENISKSASNAIQLAELERDYSITQARYTSAVTNLNTARLSERIESTSQGQRITVIESANVPRVPSGPDRPLIATSAVLVGIGLAVGYFLLLEVMNRFIRRPAELVERFGIEPITLIPYMESRREKLFRRMRMIIATLAVLIAVPVGLWYVDTYYLPLELIVQRGLDRLGLG